ncbi:GspH/FimT family pseudopilin [Herminiimonas contaminans]|uniref:Type II secretion system protein H n=2 Tax=Herminiimonas contaminans TaxID=1111140 RepID=A0ABS0ESE1_9BURK|nr:GspH/FimT family pseudopilin [Herminiimonas contaminans]
MQKVAGKAMRGRAYHSGYSIVELLVALAIVSIVLASGVPVFQKIIQAQRLATASNALFMAVNLARSEAIHRGRRVDLVPLDGMQWQRGWLVFIDENNNQRPDSHETVLHTHAVKVADLQITPRFSDSKVQYVAYSGTGRSHSNAGRQVAQSGHWLLELGPYKRKVVINFLGRPRICDPLKDKISC